MACHACIARCLSVQVVPYNLYLAMFSPAIVNVLCFDPGRRKQHTAETQTDMLKSTHTHTQNHGADQARGYAGKYCAKPEATHPAVTD